MADVTKSVAIIFSAQDQATSVSSALAGNLRGIGTAANDASGGVDKLGQETDKLGDKSKSVDVLTASMKALAASLVVKAFIDANVEAEKFERAMVLLKGSTEAASAEFKYISDLSRTLGLSLFDAADAYTSLTAATKGTALEGQATRDIFEAVSKAMSSLGKSSDDTSGALLAISQIVSKGTVSMEELRGQLGERLPGAFQIAATAMNTTTADLGKLVASGELTAEEFLPKFAAALKNTFGDASYVDGYAASFARLQNSINEAFIQIGDTGVFDLLTKGVQTATAAVTGAVAGFKLFGEVIGIVLGAISSGDLTSLGSSIDAAMQKAGNSTTAARDALLGYTEQAAASGSATKDAAGDVNLFATDVQRFTSQTDAATAALKTLGINAKTAGADALAALSTIVDSTVSSSFEVLRALESAQKKLFSTEDLERYVTIAAEAATTGKITWEKYADVVTDASQAFLKNTGYVKENTDEVKKQADETKRAQEAAEKMRLELEKLASDERIKLIEARVELNVAELEAQTARVQAAFESINNTINSTGDVITSALGLLKDFDSLDWGAIRIIEAQLEKENQLRRDAFELQKKLTEAQIEQIKAQTQNLLNGEALIKVDGAGLQPHLEAFMWEILRTIQTRVNRDGLPLLLGLQ